MSRGISLANKCQLLFGLAALLIIVAALLIPWVRYAQLVDDAQLETTRQVAKLWADNTVLEPKLVWILNRGDADGLKPGHVLAIYQDGEVIEDVIGSDIARREADAELLRREQESPSAFGRMMAAITNEVRAADHALRDFVGTPVDGGSSVKVTLPEERSGELMVFRTFDKVSYALVMNTQRPVHISDHVRNP